MIKHKDQEQEKRQEVNFKKWKEKEEEQIQIEKDYDERIDLIEIALEDYDVKIEWVNKKLSVSDLFYDNEDEIHNDEDEQLYCINYRFSLIVLHVHKRSTSQFQERIV